MILDSTKFLNPVFDGLSAAYPMSEGDGYMRRDSLQTGMDFFPSGVTSSGGYTVFNGSSTYMTTDGANIALDTGISFTGYVVLKPSALSGTRWIMAKGKQIYASDGEWSLYHSSTTINFRIHNAAGTASTTVSATLTNGVDNVVIFGYDNTNQLISIKVNAGSVVTAAHTTGVKYNFGPLCIGGPQNRWTQTTEFYNGSAKNLMFWRNVYLTSTQQATLYSQGFPFVALANQSTSLDPDNLTAKIARYDFGDVSTMWQDTAQTVAVSANNDPVRRINSLWNSKYATAPSDAVRPLLKTNTLNSRATVYSNGVDSRLDMDTAFQTVEADFTMFLIAKNDRTVLYGSHWMSSAVYNSYVTTTGTGYSGVYGAFHKSKSGSGFAPNTSTLNNTTGFNSYECFSRNTYATMIENGDDPAIYSLFRGVNTNPADWDTFFRDIYGGNWWALGNIAEVIFVETYLSVADRARVRKFLNDKWAVPNVFYRGY